MDNLSKLEGRVKRTFIKSRRLSGFGDQYLGFGDYSLRVAIEWFAAIGCAPLQSISDRFLPRRWIHRRLIIKGGKMWLFRLFLVLLSFAFLVLPSAQAWSKEGHVLTCQIAQGLLNPDATEAVQNLLPENVDGNLSALCVWPDQIRHWYRYRWTSPLHFIDTPDNSCSFLYTRDCHDNGGVENMCVAGAVRNFTTQLAHYAEGGSDRRHNLTGALLFLSHFLGDIHQPMHVGFTSDEGGNTINLRWYRHKSNLHHVWDREIILTALADYYDKDSGLLLQDIQRNLTHGIWTHEIPTWQHCEDLDSCVNKWAEESISLACKWGYEGVEAGTTLAEDYFDSRMPIVMKRIAEGGVRLAMLLNRVFSDGGGGFASST
ncbi:endonuclease 1 [Momordica charantia]|uniref:Aspergillus nuclease S1 n=1 Tax=Momordica charantia TaxID=3673 RepID=A0A6J1CEC2_MOMCH|nr:endonuclease 1 [Momordica charantia]